VWPTFSRSDGGTSRLPHQDGAYLISAHTLPRGLLGSLLDVRRERGRAEPDRGRLGLTNLGRAVAVGGLPARRVPPYSARITRSKRDDAGDTAAQVVNFLDDPSFGMWPGTAHAPFSRRFRSA